MEEAVGDSSRNLLSNVQSCARELLRAKLQHDAKIKQKDQCSKQKQSKLVTLMRQKESLLKEQIEAKVELELREQLSTNPLHTTDDDDDSNEHSIKQRIKEIESALIKCKLQLNQNNHILEYFQTREALERLSVQPASRSDSSIIECQAEQCRLVSEVCSCVQQVQTVNHQLDEVQRERAQCQQHCRSLYSKLDKLQGSTAPIDSTTNDDTDVRQSLSRCHDEVCLLVHSLQNLIFGCGVEWSKDQELLELTLKLGSMENWT